LHPEIHAAIRNGKDYLTFDTCFEAGVEVEMALCLDAQYNKAVKSMSKGQVAEKAGKYMGKGKAHHDSGKCCSSQGTS
jgi:hypothetical protein